MEGSKDLWISDYRLLFLSEPCLTRALPCDACIYCACTILGYSTWVLSYVTTKLIIPSTSWFAAGLGADMYAWHFAHSTQRFPGYHGWSYSAPVVSINIHMRSIVCPGVSCNPAFHVLTCIRNPSRRLALFVRFLPQYAEELLNIISCIVHIFRDFFKCGRNIMPPYSSISTVVDIPSSSVLNPMAVYP